MAWVFLFLCQWGLSSESVSSAYTSLSPPVFVDTISYKVYDDYDLLEREVMSAEEDEVLIVNFWATWCGPCVKELPHFENFNKTKESEKVRVILISLDFEDKIESSFVPFIEKHQLSAELYILSDTNENEWIGKVDPEWSGTIPATLFIKGKSKHFIDTEVTSVEELHEIISKI